MFGLYFSRKEYIFLNIIDKVKSRANRLGMLKINMNFGNH